MNGYYQEQGRTCILHPFCIHWLPISYQVLFKVLSHTFQYLWQRPSPDQILRPFDEICHGFLCQANHMFSTISESFWSTLALKSPKVTCLPLDYKLDDIMQEMHKS